MPDLISISSVKALLGVTGTTMGTGNTQTVTGVTTFNDDVFALWNPAGTFKYLFSTSAIVADRVITVPLLTAAGNLVIDSFANIFTDSQTINKTAQASAAETIATFKVSDDASSKIDINNSSAVDAQFIPWLKFTDNKTTTGTATFISTYINATGDSGTTPILRIDARRIGEADITTRPLLGFYNRQTLVCQINTKGDFLNTITAAASTAETLQEWRVSDSANTSFIRFANSSSTDAVFVPRIMLHNADSTGGIEATVQCTPAMDSGTVPVMIFNVRQSTPATLATRPLFDIRNNATSVFKVNVNGDISQTILAQASTAETLHQWNMSDSANGSYIRFGNLSSADAAFRPRIIIFNADDTGANEIVPQVSVAMDSGTNAVLKFTIRHDNGTVITTRPLMDILNNTTSVFKVNVNGDVVHNITAQAGVAETLANWTVSDVTTSFLNIENNSTTDAQFAPWIRSRNNNATASKNGLRITGQVTSGADTGSLPIVLIDGYLTSGANAATRPVLGITNFTTTLMTVFNNGDIDIVNGRIINSSNLRILPSYKKQGVWIPTGSSSAGSDLLSSMLFAGTQAYGLNTTQGSFLTFSTGTSSGTASGIRLGAGIVTRASNPRIKVRFTLDTITNVKMYIGFRPTVGLSTTDDPHNAAHCMMFGFSTTIGTNWILWTNGGTGATNIVDTGIAADTNQHTIEIKGVAASNKFTWSLDGAAPVDQTTEIPSSSTTQNIGVSIVNSAAEDKNIDVEYIEVEADK